MSCHDSDFQIFTKNFSFGPKMPENKHDSAWFLIPIPDEFRKLGAVILLTHAEQNRSVWPARTNISRLALAKSI